MQTNKMKRPINIIMNKSLRLDNVLIKEIFSFSQIDDEDCGEEGFFSLELTVAQMDNEIRSRGAEPIGPLIQYSGAELEQDAYSMSMALMLQSDRFINGIKRPYRMESVIKASDCLYARFTGVEEDLQYVYQKMEVTAYEEDIRLKGSSYTIFLGSDDNGNITADIFMEKMEGY